jgi:hypothetical protein
MTTQGDKTMKTVPNAAQLLETLNDATLNYSLYKAKIAGFWKQYPANLDDAAFDEADAALEAMPWYHGGEYAAQCAAEDAAMAAVAKWAAESTTDPVERDAITAVVCAAVSCRQPLTRARYLALARRTLESHAGA